MKFDHRWRALVKPGSGTVYFDVHAQRPFDPATTEYNAVNAWWLCELSRWLYKRETDETGRPEHEGRRKHILNRVGLREAQFLRNKIGTQCALVVPETSGRSTEYAVLVFRGSDELRDWRSNFTSVGVRWDAAGRVHKGFRDALNSVWDEVSRWLQDVDGPVFCTGHSLGGALATLAAARLRPAALYSFGAPRVGDRVFAESLADTPMYRVVHHRDVVAHVPPTLGPLFPFTHAGQLHYIAHDGRRIVDASDAFVVSDGGRKALPDGASIYPPRRFFDPPRSFIDHAPVNYVARLERDVSLTLPSQREGRTR